LTLSVFPISLSFLFFWYEIAVYGMKESDTQLYDIEFQTDGALTLKAFADNAVIRGTDSNLPDSPEAIRNFYPIPRGTPQRGGVKNTGIGIICDFRLKSPFI